MILAKIEITATEAKTIYKMDIPANLKGGEIQLVYTDPIWDGMVKIYLFNDHFEARSRVLPSGLVTIPESVLVANQHLRFGIFGMDSKGEIIIPTIYADLGIVKESADPGFDPGLDPDLPVWMQILQRIGDPTLLKTMCKSDQVCAINEIWETSEEAIEIAKAIRKEAASGQFDGFSPTATTEETPDGALLIVTDRYGETRALIKGAPQIDDSQPSPTNPWSGKKTSEELDKKQNWATSKLASFPEAASPDTLHAWVNANHKGPDRKWLVESSNPDWAALVSSLGGTPEGVNPGDSAFILLEIPYSEAGPEMLRAQYVLRKSPGVWDMTQYATYSTPTPTWHSTGWVKEEKAPKQVITAVITWEVNHLVCDMTASEIIDASRRGVVKAEYTDDASGETREYYYFKQLADGRACFTKDGYIEDGVPKQTLFYVDFAGNVKYETRDPDATTCYATCTAEAAPQTTTPVTWYVPKTMPRPSGNPGMLIDVFWANGRADGLGYDVSLVWGSEGGSDNEVIAPKISVTDSLTGEYSIPAEGTVRYQLEEIDGRKHWKFVSGNVIGKQFSSATAAEIADKVVPGMEIAYLPGMEIFVQLDKGNTADVMNLAPVDGQALPVYGNGVGAKTGPIKAGTVLHLKNAGDHWQIINFGGDSIDDEKTSRDTTWSSTQIVEILCPPFEKSGPVVTCNPVVGYPLSVKSQIVPRQEGSGDPSPENVRPILPTEKVELVRCGVNLIDPTKISEVGKGSLEIYSSKKGYSGFNCKKGVQYTLSTKQNQKYIFRVVNFLTDEFLENKYVTSLTFNVAEDTRVYFTISVSGAFEEKPNPQLAVSSIATPYEPYTGEVYTAELPPDTYGGEVNWEKGEFLNSFLIVSAQNLPWREEVAKDGNRYVTTVDGAIDSDTTENAQNESYCSALTLLAKDTTFTGAYTGYTIYSSKIFVRVIGVNTLDDIMAFFTSKNVEFLVPISDKSILITTSGTPTPIPGVNTLYSDTGDTTVSGREDPIATIAALTKRVTDLENTAEPLPGPTV